MGVAAISEDMEQRVLEASYALRDSLGEADDAISATRKELDVDGILVQGDMAYVEVGGTFTLLWCGSWHHGYVEDGRGTKYGVLYLNKGY